MILRVVDPVKVNPLLQRDFPQGDLTDFLINPLNVCLVSGESGTLFAWRGPGVFEAHVFYAVRGAEALRLAGSMQDTMRRAYGAQYFWSLLPLENRAARMFCRLIGWKSQGHLQTQYGSEEMFVSETIPCRH